MSYRLTAGYENYTPNDDLQKEAMRRFTTGNEWP